MREINGAARASRTRSVIGYQSVQTTSRALLVLLAMTASAAELAPLPQFPKHESALRIVAPCVPHTPWTVAGEQGALFGRQNGVFEAWLWPNKILSGFRIRAELADYAVPIDVNALAAQIEVTPAETTIIYSHAAFTIRQHMFAPRGEAAPSTGAAVYFEIESARALEITFSFTPEMLHMWPAPNFGRPNGEWIAKSGFYILHTDDPHFSAVVAMPRTRPGILVPYQEHPQTSPLELRSHRSFAADAAQDRRAWRRPAVRGLARPAHPAVAGSVRARAAAPRFR